MFGLNIEIAESFSMEERAVLFHGSCLELLKDIPDRSMQLIERLVLSMTNEGDWVFDPFLGTGTSIIAAIRHNRRGVGAETEKKYIRIARERIQKAIDGTLRVRPMNKPKYDPKSTKNRLTISPWKKKEDLKQLSLLEDPGKYHYEIAAISNELRCSLL